MRTGTKLADVEHGNRDAAGTWNYRRLMAAIVARACWEVYFLDSEEAREWLLKSEVAQYILDFLGLPSGEVLLAQLADLPHYPRGGGGRGPRVCKRKQTVNTPSQEAP